MKTPLVLLLAWFALPLRADDTQAIQLFDRAAQLQGFAAQSLDALEMEVVFSNLSGGTTGPSRWLTRLDFKKHLDLGVRYVYDENDRGAFFQRRIEGDKGQFLYGMGSKTAYDIGGYRAGNEVEGVAGVALLAVRGQLADLKYVGKATFGNQVLDEVTFTYHQGAGTAFFAPDGRFAGRLERNLKDNIDIFQIVTAYQTIEGFQVPTRWVLYDTKKKAGGYAKLVSFRANPVFTKEDFDMKATPYDDRGTRNPFGLVLVPARAADFEGLAVGPEPEDAAEKAGLAEGDEIVSVDGKDVTKGDFFELEKTFWDKKNVVLGVVKTGTQKPAVVTLTP